MKAGVGRSPSQNHRGTIAGSPKPTAATSPILEAGKASIAVRMPNGRAAAVATSMRRGFGQGELPGRAPGEDNKVAGAVRAPLAAAPPAPGPPPRPGPIR